MVDTWFCLYFFGLKLNLKKPEIADIGVLREVKVAVLGTRYRDLNNYTLKILLTHFSDSKKLKEEKKFKTVTDT